MILANPVMVPRAQSGPIKPETASFTTVLLVDGDSVGPTPRMVWALIVIPLACRK